MIQFPYEMTSLIAEFSDLQGVVPELNLSKASNPDKIRT